MWSRLISGVVVGAVAVSGCVTSSSVEPDFFGELRTADLERWQISESNNGGNAAFATGGPDSPLLVGPATFQLSAGQAVKIPPDTPGGNMCKILGYPDQPHDAPCLVAGIFADAHADEAEWFIAQPFEPDDQGHFTLYVDDVEERNALVWVGSVSIPVPIRRDAELECTEYGDLTVTPLDLPARSSFQATLNGDLEVVRLSCLYGD